MTPQHVAVIDIGKTNAKLALFDTQSMSEIAVVTRPNIVQPGPPWPHFDLEGHWQFLLAALAKFQRQHGVDAISVTTHGASAVLLDAGGNLAAPMLDYEHQGPMDAADAYNKIRPPFEATGSPRLSGGLNLGAQLHWQFHQDPGLLGRTRHIVTYPQYWGFRLTGVAATDVTSLGCHTDLWEPQNHRFSSLVDALGITDRIAQPRLCSDVLGTILPEIAVNTGLAADTPVHCGIHDSNASLLPHIIGREGPFSVVSTGTWVVAMAVGGVDVALDPSRDTLINVDAFGRPVPSARFMGGREFELASQGQPVAPTDADMEDTLDRRIMLLPSLQSDVGPFQGQSAGWLPDEPASGTGARAAAIAFYLALVTTRCLQLIGHKGPVLVEGPFGRSTAYLHMLASASGCDVSFARSATGTSTGAALLTLSAVQGPVSAESVRPAGSANKMKGYARDWFQLSDSIPATS